MVDKKRGSSRKNLIDLVFIFSLIVFFIYFITANRADIISDNFPLMPNFTYNNSYSGLYNITINTSAAGSNITSVNVTLWNNTVSGINYGVNWNFSMWNTGTSNGTGNQTGGMLDYVSIFFSNRTDEYGNIILSWNHTGAAGEKVVALGNQTGTFWIWFNASADVPGMYNISVKISYNDSAYYDEYNLTTIINDTKAPYNVANHSTSFTPGGNYSGTLLINLSTLDNLVIQSVWINVTNSSGMDGSNSSTMFEASNSSTSPNYWVYVLDTENFPDGINYNITFWVNDSTGNVNNTVTFGNLTFDNSAPTGTMRCTPSDAYVGSTITCTCYTSDALSGLSSTTYTVNPSTTNAGADLTQTCTSTDLAGNIAAIVSNTYTIWGSPDGAGSSGGHSGTPFTYSKTIPETNQDFSELNKIETSSFSGGGLGAKEKVTFKLNEEEHYLGIRALTVSSATIEIASTPIQVNLNMGDETKQDLDGDGFYDLYVKLNNIINGKADLTMQYIHEEISASAGEETQTGEEETGEQQPEGTQQMPLWVWGIIIAALILIILVTIALLKKKKKRK